MARQKNRSAETAEIEQPIEALPETAELQPEPVAFLTWFVQACDRHRHLKPHHMHALRTYCEHAGLREHETADRFEQALKRYGIE